MEKVIAWLNDEPPAGPLMQRDGVYALLSWRDIRHNGNIKGWDFRMLTLMAILAVGLPLLFLA